MTKYIMVVCEVATNGTTYSNLCEFSVKRDCDNFRILRGKLGALNVSIPKKGGVVINYEKYETREYSEHDRELIREGLSMSDRDTRRGV